MKLHNTSRSLAKRWLLQTNHFSSVSFVEEKRKNPQSQRPCGFMVAGARFELTTFGLWAQRATGLLHPAIYWFLKEDLDRYANRICCNVSVKPNLIRQSSGYEPDELPDCSTPRYWLSWVLYYYIVPVIKNQAFFEKRQKNFFDRRTAGEKHLRTRSNTRYNKP